MQDQLQSDLKEAMKTGDKTKVSVLRMLLAACKNKQIEKRGELADEEVLGVLSKQAKQREDSIRAYREAGREDLAEKELAELDLIKQYLPEPLSEQEVVSLVTEAIEAVEAKSMKDMGQVMKWLAPKIKGRFDGGKASSLVKEKLTV